MGCISDVSVIDRTVQKRRVAMQSAVDAYHKFYEKHKLWQNTKWLGIPMWKLPSDSLIIQDIIYEVKPDYIVETGTAYGGSALFYASLCELIDHGSVLTIDIEFKHDHILSEVKQSVKDRITYIGGSSINEIVVSRVKDICEGKRNIVLLDSWHTKEHVLQELKLYSPLVSVGSYIIVEDTHVNGHPVPWKWNDEGPWGAVEEFMKDNEEFEVDYSKEKYLMTFNPSGWLRRVKKGE